MNRSSISLLYKAGDTVTINNIEWVVHDITEKFGHYKVYGLYRKGENGRHEHWSIGVNSLKTLMRAKR